LQTWRTPRLDSQPWRLAILTAQQSAPASSRPTYWCAHSCKKINRLTTDGYRLSLRGLRTITPGNAYPTPGDVLLLTTRAARQFMRLPAIRVAPAHAWPVTFDCPDVTLPPMASNAMAPDTIRCLKPLCMGSTVIVIMPIEQSFSTRLCPGAHAPSTDLATNPHAHGDLSMSVRAKAQSSSRRCAGCPILPLLSRPIRARR